MIKFVGQDELKAIREHAECDFPFDEAEEDVRKLLGYIDCLENMPFVKAVIKLQEENERLTTVLEIANDCLFGNTYGDHALEEAYQTVSCALDTLLVKCDECGTVLDRRKGEDFFIEQSHGKSVVLCEKDWKAHQDLEGANS